MHRRSRFLVLATALVATLAFAGNGAARKESFVHDPVLKAIKVYRSTTWHWQRVMGVRQTPTSREQQRLRSLVYRRWVMHLWERRAHFATRRAHHVPHLGAWLCIHRYEGSWSANSGNGYFGGLQMDVTFMRHYGGYLLGRKGTAEHWTPLEQMWVAERALQAGRGFYPWPHTARACGLI